MVLEKKIYMICGKIIGRISGKISIRYDPSYNYIFQITSNLTLVPSLQQTYFLTCCFHLTQVLVMFRHSSGRRMYGALSVYRFSCAGRGGVAGNSVIAGLCSLIHDLYQQSGSRSVLVVCSVSQSYLSFFLTLFCLLTDFSVS